MIKKTDTGEEEIEDNSVKYNDNYPQDLGFAGADGVNNLLTCNDIIISEDSFVGMQIAPDYRAILAKDTTGESIDQKSVAPTRDYFLEAFPDTKSKRTQSKPEDILSEEEENRVGGSEGLDKNKYKNFSTDDLNFLKELGFQEYSDASRLAFENEDLGVVVIFESNELRVEIGSPSVELVIDLDKFTEDFSDKFKVLVEALKQHEDKKAFNDFKTHFFKTLLSIEHTKITLNKYSLNGLNLFGKAFNNPDFVHCELNNCIIEAVNPNFNSCESEDSNLIVSGSVCIREIDFNATSSFGHNVFFHTRTSQNVKSFIVDYNVSFHSNIIDIEVAQAGAVEIIGITCEDDDNYDKDDLIRKDDLVIKKSLISSSCPLSLLERNKPALMQEQLDILRFDQKKTLKLMAGSPFFSVDFVPKYSDKESKVYQFNDKFYILKRFSKQILISDSSDIGDLRVADNSELDFINLNLLYVSDNLNDIYRVTSVQLRIE